MLDLEAVFEKHEDKFLTFEEVKNRRHDRPDLCAFLMLHDLAPREPVATGAYVRDMVACTEHDEIWLDTDVRLLAANATEEDIVTLIRCGIRYDSEHEALAMFV